jgi:hypothetical protein
MSYFPPPAKTAFVTTWRASKSFRYKGRPVMRGEILEQDDPLVAVVNKTNPGLLLVSVRERRRSECLS